MAPSLSPLLSLIIILLLLPITTTAIPETTIFSAAEILSNTNHNSMSLTLSLISTALSRSLSSLHSATLFSPSDAAFSSSTSAGQPSLSLLNLHFCPRLYSPADLLSLPYGSHLPTLLPNSSLSISSTIFDDFVSLNGVKISSRPIFYDPSFVVYSIDTFFSASYWADNSVSELSPGPSYTAPSCHVSASAKGEYWEAAAALRTRGYSRMAGFLDVQVSQFDEGRSVITVFAPRDEAMEGYLGNYSDWGSVFLRHVIGCHMSWPDLLALNGGTVLGTFLKGYGIKVEKTSEGYLVLNQNLTVNFPDFYRDDRILVHGLSGVFNVPPQDNEPAAAHHVGRHGGSYTATPYVDSKTTSDHLEF